MPFLKYAKSCFVAEQETLAFRIYVTDSLFYQSQEKRLSKRYADIIMINESVDDRSGDEIALDIIARFGLEVAP